jgi:hypothetical protein
MLYCRTQTWLRLDDFSLTVIHKGPQNHNYNKKSNLFQQIRRKVSHRSAVQATADMPAMPAVQSENIHISQLLKLEMSINRLL